MGNCKDCEFWIEGREGECVALCENNEGSKVRLYLEDLGYTKPPIFTVITAPDFGCTLFQRRFKDEKCGSCGGSGDIAFERSSPVVCHVCEGVGRIPDGRGYPCDACSGTGSQGKKEGV